MAKNAVTKTSGTVRKRARKGSGSVSVKKYTNKDGSISTYYQGRITVGYNLDGTPIQKCVSGDTIASVQAKMDDLKYKWKNHLVSESSKITLEEYEGSWLESLSDISESTRRIYSNSFRLYIAPRLGKIPIQKLKASDIRIFLKELQEPGLVTVNGLDSKTVKDVRSVLHRILNCALYDELISVNPCTWVKPSKTGKPKKRSKRNLSEEEIRLLLSVFSMHKHNLFFRFSLFFGLREMENLGLTIGDIDFDKKSFISGISSERI